MSRLELKPGSRKADDSSCTAFTKLGVRVVGCPGSYFEDVDLTRPLSIGGYRHSGTPGEPIVVRMLQIPPVPEARGFRRRSSGKHPARRRLVATFETFERKIRDPAQPDTVCRGLRPGARHRGDHAEPLAAWLCVRPRFGDGSGRLDARRATARTFPVACRRRDNVIGNTRWPPFG